MIGNNIFVWNVRGLNMRARRAAVHVKERASALCLVETKIAVRWTAISKEWALAGYAPVAALHFIWSQNWNVM